MKAPKIFHVSVKLSNASGSWTITKLRKYAKLLLEYPDLKVKSVKIEVENNK